MPETLTTQFTRIKPELEAYLRRLVIRPQLAEELVQSTYLRGLEAQERLPETEEGLRAWLFKVASNLAFDELRRHRNWREHLLDDLRTRAQADPVFIERSRAMASTPETRLVAREHLATCFACTLRNLPEQQAAAVLLKEVHGFSLEELAQLLEARPAQVKHWLQAGRATLDERFGQTCALVVKQGVCHQCVQLDEFLQARQGDPLAGDTRLARRIEIVAEQRSAPLGPWHRLMFTLMDDLRH